MIVVEATEKYAELRKRSELGVSEYFESLLAELTPEERVTISEGLTILNRVLAPKDDDI